MTFVQKKRVIKLSIVSVLFVSLLVLIPLVVEWQAERWLQQQGVADADIGDVDINLFTGEVGLTGLVVGRDTPARFQLASLYLNIDYLPLFQKRIQIQAVRVSGMDLDLTLDEVGRVHLGALVLPAKGEAQPVEEGAGGDAGGWGFGLGMVAMDGLEVRLHTAQHDGVVLLQQLRVGALASWHREQVSAISLKMVVDGARLELTTDVSPFKAEPDWRGEVLLEGVELANYAPFMKPAGLAEVAGKLALDARLSGRWREDESLALQFDSQLRAEGVRLVHSQGQFSQGALTWQGKGQLHFPPREGEALVDVDNQLVLKDTQLVLSDGKMIKQASLQWQGMVGYSEDHSSPGDGVNVQGRLSVAGVTLEDPQADLMLARFESLGVDGIGIAGLDQISVQSIALDGLALLGDVNAQPQAPYQQMLSLARIDVASLSVREQQFAAIEAIDLDGMQLAALLNESAQVQWLARLTPAQGNGVESETSGEIAEVGEAAETTAVERSPFTFRVDKVAIGGDSWIVFEDVSVKPAFRAKLAPLSVVIENLDSSQPEQAAQLTLDTQLDKYTDFKLAGKFWLFQEALSTDIKGALTGLDLSALSPYAVTHMGYALRRGQLDNQIDLRIDNGLLDINNRLHISKLNIVEADSEKASEFSAGLAMPLDMALGLLKDGDGNIEFDMPIKGDVSAPEFSMSGVINLALGKALKMAAMNYVTSALQPLGTVMFVGKLLGKAMELRFKPLTFDAGSREFNETGRAYAEKIAGMVIARPELKLTFCGVANGEDVVLLREALLAEQAVSDKVGEVGAEAAPLVDGEVVKARALELAKVRGELLKSFFVNEKGVDAERLFSCRPMLDLEEGAEPRVEITL